MSFVSYVLILYFSSQFGSLNYNHLRQKLLLLDVNLFILVK